MVIAATSPLLLLAALACPIGMVAMMLVMGRGMMGGTKHEHSDGGRRSLADLKAEQARLAEQIEALEARQTPAAVEDEQETQRVS